METYKIQFIETLFTLGAFLTIRFILNYFVKLTVLKAYFKLVERKEILKMINLLLLIAFCIITISIWSVKQENILFVASSLLTVFGVALFAEMSILSNITACLILFFQHPIKIGDFISILQDGHPLEGEVIEISYFFMFIKTPNRGTLSIPNALLLKTAFIIESKPEEQH
ncbi:MAG TPA: mechanosensitive ion channel protein MscS [Chitinophagaceae bacterium]|nr:mechanosensitive ion channel protein MscS [Chitinophagaceae bacterium]